MKDFDEVSKCKDVAEFIEFSDEYCKERNIEFGTEEYHKTRWALFYRFWEIEQK